ncbi:hypothetical protein [Legionella yabuuchiae]|uniref:hypothetical protein n=1 Tax=Legionella yabuuchiae TaxID=376727 RepID=UPI00105549C2|nr:hypothetical protein [Legionella yabuuchiae]
MILDIVNKTIALQEQSPEGKIIVVGITGPTASGKSTLAAAVENQLLQLGKSVVGVKMDWVLKERSAREADLKLIISRMTFMPYEPYHHMELNHIHRFLEKVRYYNKQLLEKDSKLTKDKTIVLKHLYNRVDGLSNHRQEIHLKPHLIILLDGSYNLIHYLDYYVDFQYLILADLDELLQRLLVRAFAYRAPALIKEYFLRINLPSILHYLAVYLQNADIIVDNTNWDGPRIMSQKEVFKWIAKAQEWMRSV